MTQTEALICTSAEETFSVEGFNFTYQTLNWKRTAGYINKCWYSQFLDFIQATQIKVVNDFSRLQLLWVDNKFLMDCFVNKVQGKQLCLCKLNYIQISLHAISLADIMTSNGKKMSRA